MRHTFVYIAPLILIAVGVIIYVVVTAYTTPTISTITAQPMSITPLSSSSATPAPATDPAISLTVVPPTSTQQVAWQQASTTDTWRVDPVQVAKRESLSHGFVAEDPFTLQQSTTSIGQADSIGTHRGFSYTFHLIQPQMQGAKGIWVVQSITARP